MIANIFVCDKSFAFNGVDSIKDIQKKILGMRKLFSAIKARRTENHLFLQHEDFLKTIIYDEDTIGDVIYGEEEKKANMKEKYSRDVYNLLFTLFNTTRSTSFTHEDMIGFLSDDFEEPDTCYGMAVMNHLEDLPDTKQVVYDEKGFFKFRRYYIGKLVNDPEEFMNQIETYYDNLILNNDRDFFKEKLNEVVSSHGICIVNCLTVLSEHFKEEFNNKEEMGSDNLSNFLELFARRYGIDDGSLEGKNEKAELNCSFKKTRDMDCEETITKYCGPHLKMYHDDSNKENCHMRVYFAWDSANLDIVYIGMISSHVKE